MPRITETVAGGLVNARDPAQLSPGELQALQNCVYAPGDLALRRATGRLAFGAATADHTPVRGLRAIEFDNSDHFLVALVGNTLSTALVADTGTFAMGTGLAATSSSLESIHNFEDWFMLAGVPSSAIPLVSTSIATGRNWIAYLTATAPGQQVFWRRHGMIPIEASPTLTTGAGTWTAGSIGFFEYWSTETASYIKNGTPYFTESTFVGKPTTIYVSATSIQATAEVAGPINPEAYKWTMYRAGPKTTSREQLFPRGFVIAEGLFASGSEFVEGGYTTSAYATANAVAPSPGTAWANPGSGTGIEDAFAANAIVSAGFERFFTVSYPAITITNPIIGVNVAIRGERSNTSVKCEASISFNNGATFSPPKTISNSTSNENTFVVGGLPPGEFSGTWGTPGTAEDVATAGRFQVRFRAYSTSFGSGQYDIDTSAVRFHHGGTADNDRLDEPFPAVGVEINGVDASVGSHGKPPIATTGDIFMGHLVTNDVDHPALTWHSIPTEPEYFPPVYFIDYETPDNDRVTLIRTLSNRLGVFLRTRFYRVNYLPTEADANFNRGICKEEVSAQVGCVSPMCAAVYEGITGRSEIAFVANTGIYSTDLYKVTDLTANLDWRSIIATANSTPIALINDPEHGELLFYYRNDALAANETYKCLHLSYDDAHIGADRLKISGQVNMRNYHSATTARADIYSAWSVTRSSGTTSVYLGYGGDSASATAAGAGAVYRETGSIIPAEDPTMRYTTRRIFLDDYSNEVQINEIYTYIPLANASGQQSWALTPSITLTNNALGLIAQSPESYTWMGANMFKFQFNQAAEGFQYMFAQASASANNPFAVQHHVIDYARFGEEDSGS